MGLLGLSQNTAVFLRSSVWWPRRSMAPGAVSGAPALPAAPVSRRHASLGLTLGLTELSCVVGPLEFCARRARQMLYERAARDGGLWPTICSWQLHCLTDFTYELKDEVNTNFEVLTAKHEAECETF